MSGAFRSHTLARALDGAPAPSQNIAMTTARIIIAICIITG